MSLETRARSAVEALMAATSIDTESQLAHLRKAHARRNATRVSAAVGTVVVIVLVVVGADLRADRHRAEPAPAGLPVATMSPSHAVGPINTKTWKSCTSDRYGFKVGHPRDWVEMPASRDWRPGTHTEGPASPALETFRSPSDSVRVSVWNEPLNPATSIESLADVEVWAKEYCERTGSTPCTGIGHRAVELCLEKWDCHPGLLVPFDNDVQAFFSGGIYDGRAMTVVAVWWGESAPAVAPYGGSQRLLEAFLSTMAVWPASTPREQRE